MPEWLKGADCKSVGDAYDGSNPSLPTNFVRNALLGKCFFIPHENFLIHKENA